LKRDVTQEWLLTDDSTGVRRIVVGHFNWSAEDPVSLATPIENLGLDPTIRCVGFDYWANAFVAPINESLDTVLQPATCRVVSVYPEADHPQLVSTSRHITQGIVDVLAEAWDPARQTLSGESRVVPGDLYELRIVVPAAEPAWTSAGARIVKGDAEADVALSQEGRGIRVKVKSARGGQLSWQIHFERTAVDLDKPAGENKE
jgi:hypothetical protein